jgi:hypothetical protein
MTFILFFLNFSRQFAYWEHLDEFFLLYSAITDTDSLHFRHTVLSLAAEKKLLFHFSQNALPSVPVFLSL